MTTHEEIARERYLDMLANGTPPQAAVEQAIDEATVFVLKYSAWAHEERIASRGFRKLKGCPACFGSGGKRDAPCRACGGTGKVPDHKPGEPLTIQAVR